MSARNSSQQPRSLTGQTPTSPPKLYQFKLVLLGTYTLTLGTRANFSPTGESAVGKVLSRSPPKLTLVTELISFAVCEEPI